MATPLDAMGGGTGGGEEIAPDQVRVGELSGEVAHFNTSDGWSQTREEVDALYIAGDQDALTSFAGECEANELDPKNCLACYAFTLLVPPMELPPQEEPPRWDNSASNNAAIDEFVAAEREAQRTVLEMCHESQEDVILMLDGGHTVAGKVTRVADMVVDIRGLLESEDGEPVELTWSVNRSRVVAVGRE